MSDTTGGQLTREELRAQLAALAQQSGANLKPGELARKPDFQGKQVEALAVAQDNVVLAKHPEMTRNLSPEEQESLEALGQAIPGMSQPTSVSSVAIPAPVAAPVLPVTKKSAPLRILLTGRSGVGKNFLAAQVTGARVVELTDSIDVFLREFFPDFDPTAPALDSFRSTVKAWGNGVLNEKYPLTPARFLFTRFAKHRWPGFGGLDFWVNQLIQNSNEAGQSIVTRVETEAEYKALVSAGFRHYHVIASTSTMNQRVQRKSADNRLAAAMDADVIRKLSANRQGERLRVIWNDPASQPPSQRVFTVSQWLHEVAVESLPETGE